MAAPPVAAVPVAAPPVAASPVVAPPVLADEADRLLAGLHGRRVLLAVSGGADSVALMGLCSLWARRHGEAPPAVAVVDHGLRSGSADEARFVVQSAEALGLKGVILHWQGAKPAAGLQASAREARYRLLAAHARALEADAIATAHTLDDQAETVMMRLSRGSGLAGLAGMAAVASMSGLLHLRPLLGLSKPRLTATCQDQGWTWIEDPSNRDPRFTRARWRALLPALAGEGLDAARLARFAARMARADRALDAVARQTLSSCRLPAEGGESWRLDGARLAQSPEEVRLRVLVLAVIGEGEEGVIRLERAEACCAALFEALLQGRSLTRTLAGQIIAAAQGGLLSGRPEPARRRGCVNPVQAQRLGNRACED